MNRTLHALRVQLDVGFAGGWQFSAQVGLFQWAWEAVGKGEVGYRHDGRVFQRDRTFRRQLLQFLEGRGEG